MRSRFYAFLGFNRRIALGLAPHLARTPLTPNHWTSAALLCGLFSAFLFSRGSQAALLCGAFFFQVYSILDNCDGAVARIKGLSSRFGMWYDFVSDLIVDF